jgi:hypothetical protein
MPTNRTSEMSCLLCQINKADATGSHFAPAWIIEPTVGKRDSEEAYSIDAEAHEIDVHYGRENKKAKEGVISKNPHVRDFIFCSQCEKKLGLIESEIAPFLKEKIYYDKYKSQFKFEDLGGGNVKLSTTKFSAAVFHAFIYSVIWRICLQQRLETNTSSTSPAIEERLRYFLIDKLSKSIKELKEMEFSLSYPYAIFTSNGIDIKQASLINPDSELTNPLLFYIGKILVLMHFGESLAGKDQSSKFPTELNDLSICNIDTKSIIITFIPIELWAHLNKLVLEDFSKLWIQNAVIKIVAASGVQYEVANQKLMAETKNIVDKGGLEWGEALTVALQNILAS